MSSEICLKQLEARSRCSPDQLDEPVLRSSSMSNLSCEIMVDPAVNFRKRRWKAMSSGISSIRRFVKPSMASEQLAERRTLFHRPDNHYELCESSLYRSVDGLPDKPAMQKQASGDAGERSPVSTAPEFVATSSSRLGGVGEKQRTMHANSKKQTHQRAPKDGSPRSQLIYGLSHSSTSVPEQALCVNPYFMPSNNNSKFYSGPVFISPAPGLPAGKPESLAWQRKPMPNTYFSFKPTAARRLSPTYTPPSSYDEICSPGDDRTLHRSLSSMGIQHQSSASEASLEGCSEKSHSQLGKRVSTTSSAYSFSSSSCATWSQDTTPARSQPEAGGFESGAHRLPAHERRAAWSRRPLPNIPTSPDTDASDVYKRDYSSGTRHSSASVSPITPSSSSSSLGGLDSRSYLLENFDKLKRLTWYWGPLSREDSERLLDDAKDGDFLLRDSSNQTHFFVLSVRSGGRTVHVLTDNRQLDEEWPESSGGSGSGGAAQDVLQCLHANIRPNASGQAAVETRSVPSGELLFLTPLLRYTRVPSLQHLCRLALRANCCLSREDIDKLQLPTRIKMFLDQRNVFTE